MMLLQAAVRVCLHDLDDGRMAFAILEVPCLCDLFTVAQPVWLNTVVQHLASTTWKTVLQQQIG